MRRLLKFMLLLASTVASGQLYGQTAPATEAGQLETSRDGLTDLLARYEQAAASPASGADAQAAAMREAAVIRLRLSDGDFRVGDVVDLRVEGEESLNGSFVVNNEGALVLPLIGQVSLRGVLRSELSEYLRGYLSRYLVEPRVTASSSIRIMITGSGTPGIFVVPTQNLLSDAIMSAGGPSGTSDLTAVRVERGEDVLWESEELRTAMAQGLTIEQLNLRSGDHVVIPPMESNSSLFSAITVVPSVLLAIVSLIRLF